MTAALRGLGRLLWNQRLRPVWMTALAMWVVFFAFRLGLLVACWDALHNVDGWEVAKCFAVGARFDGMPIGFSIWLLILILAIAPAAAFRYRVFRYSVVLVSALLVGASVAIEVVGAGYFLELGNGTKLNWICLDYFDCFEDVYRYIKQEYPLTWVEVGLGAVVVVFLLLFNWLFWKGQRPNGSRKFRLGYATAAIAVCLVLGRGSLGSQSLRMAEAYFCPQNKTICELSLNNFYTLTLAALSHMDEVREEETEYPLPPMDDARPVVQRMIYQASDVSIGDGANPLLRRTASTGPAMDVNVVIIVMEGMSSKPVGALGHSPSHTPFLDSLVADGLYIENMYAVGTRTCRGLAGILCGYPDLRGQPVLKRDRSKGHFATLPAVFRDRGYKTMFVYGGDPRFDNMKDFFGREQGGIDEFVGFSQQDRDQRPEMFGFWGAHDELLAERAHETFEKMRKDRFFAVMLTVTNHQPYDVPTRNCPTLLPDDGTDEIKVVNGYRYADWSLAEFFAKARKADYFKNTIFVLVADHGRGTDRTTLVDVAQHRVPCLFYAPGIVAPGRLGVTASQTDIAPTLLGMLGGGYSHCFFGRDLRGVAAGDGFAYINENTRLTLVRDDWAVTMLPQCDGWLYSLQGMASNRDDCESPEAQARKSRMQQELLSYYQMAWQMYLKGAYRLPAGRL